jgi:transposase-like protein
MATSSILSRPWFHSVPAAYDYMEKILWSGEAVCPHCGTVGNSTKLQGKATRPGVWKCKTKECRKQFTVTVGTVFESRHIPLPKMLQAVYLMSCSKKGISAHQLHRILGVTYKTAWFLAHRIREAMRDGTLAPMGGAGGIIEADETYFGWQEDPQPSAKRKGRPFTKGGKAGPAGKRAVVALVERGGRVRSFHPAQADGKEVAKIVGNNIEREARLMTDESRLYIGPGKWFASHETVTHSHGEYVRYTKERVIHTNTVEGYFSIFKRGMKGIYQHCSEKHLHRYLAEFDFRYNNRSALGVEDVERSRNALKGIVGKRLTYRNPHVTAAE